MKKQYKIVPYKSFMVRLHKYHDGVEVYCEKWWEDDELFDEIEKLKENGYTPGFFDYEVEDAKETYEYLLANRIDLKEQ